MLKKMFGHTHRIVGRVENHGLKKHETVVFHARETDPDAILLPPADHAGEGENETGTASGFMEFQTAVLAHGKIGRTLDEKAPQTEISYRKLPLQFPLAVHLDASGKNHPDIHSFFWGEDQWSRYRHARPCTEIFPFLPFSIASMRTSGKQNSLFVSHFTASSFRFAPVSHEKRLSGAA
nr:hypothetical protein [Desulfobulbus elongatus]